MQFNGLRSDGLRQFLHRHKHSLQQRVRELDRAVIADAGRVRILRCFHWPNRMVVLLNDFVDRESCAVLTPLSRSNISATIADRDAIEALTDLVREVYQSHRLRGLKQDEAYESAAADLGVSLSAVKRLLTGYMFSVSVEQAEAIRTGHVAALQSLRDWHQHRAHQISNRLQVLEAEKRT